MLRERSDLLAGLPAQCCNRDPYVALKNRQVDFDLREVSDR
jgi:hypothetical protein